MPDQEPTEANFSYVPLHAHGWMASMSSLEMLSREWKLLRVSNLLDPVQVVLPGYVIISYLHLSIHKVLLFVGILRNRIHYGVVVK